MLHLLHYSIISKNNQCNHFNQFIIICKHELSFLMGIQWDPQGVAPNMIWFKHIFIQWKHTINKEWTSLYLCLLWLYSQGWFHHERVWQAEREGCGMYSSYRILNYTKHVSLLLLDTSKAKNGALLKKSHLWMGRRLMPTFHTIPYPRQRSEDSSTILYLNHYYYQY